MELQRITSRYERALLWAAELHRHQLREGKSVPYLSHVMAVSSLVWEDGGNEDQAIAALLHDAIEDAGESHSSIAARCGKAVADIVSDCTDQLKSRLAQPSQELWLLGKSRYLDSLGHKAETSLLVTAADKAHNALDHLLDARRDPLHWQRTLAGLEGWAWYYQRLFHELAPRLPGSRSVERLGQAVEGITALPDFQQLLAGRTAPLDWAFALEASAKSGHPG